MFSKRAIGALMLKICVEKGLKVEKAALLHIASSLTEELNAADMIRKKLGSVELSRKTLQRQLDEHDAEEEKLRSQCSHLHLMGETDTGGNTAYTCGICGAEVVPRSNRGSM